MSTHVMNTTPAFPLRRQRPSRSRAPREIVAEYSNYPSKLALDIWEYVTSIGFYRKYPKGYDLQMRGSIHSYLLHYVRRGEVQHVVGGQTYRVGPRCACWLDCSKPYRHFNASGAAADICWVAFDGRITPRLWMELGADQNPLFEHLDGRRFEALFDELLALVVQKPVAHEAKAHVALSAILVELMLSRAQSSRAPSLVDRKSVLSDKVRQAVEIFERNFYYPKLSLKEVGSRVGTDIFQLSRKFRREVGMPPIQYLNRYRVEQARHLLSISDDSVKQIARLVGISDPDYLARVFRKVTGQSPRAFRGKQQRPRPRTSS